MNIHIGLDWTEDPSLRKMVLWVLVIKILLLQRGHMNRSATISFPSFFPSQRQRTNSHIEVQVRYWEAMSTSNIWDWKNSYFFHWIWRGHSTNVRRRYNWCNDRCQDRLDYKTRKIGITHTISNQTILQRLSIGY